MTTIGGKTLQSLNIADPTPVLVGGVSITIEDESGQTLQSGESDAGGCYEIPGFTLGKYVVRAELDDLPPVSGLVEILFPGFTVRNLTFYPANESCQSDDTFELVRGNAFVEPTPTWFGEVDFDTGFRNPLFHSPETAAICITGDPARPTISWGQDFFPQRPFASPKLVNNIRVDEIISDCTSLGRHMVLWSFFVGQSIEPPVKYGEGDPEAPPLQAGKHYAVILNDLVELQMELEFIVR